jgi:hypothetical protein
MYASITLDLRALATLHPALRARPRPSPSGPRRSGEQDRIRVLLKQAVASATRIWLANQMHLVESEMEIWWQILDVRPVETLAPAA